MSTKAIGRPLQPNSTKIDLPTGLYPQRVDEGGYELTEEEYLSLRAESQHVLAAGDSEEVEDDQAPTNTKHRSGEALLSAADRYAPYASYSSTIIQANLQQLDPARLPHHDPPTSPPIPSTSCFFPPTNPLPLPTQSPSTSKRIPFSHSSTFIDPLTKQRISRAPTQKPHSGSLKTHTRSSQSRSCSPKKCRKGR